MLNSNNELVFGIKSNKYGKDYEVIVAFRIGKKAYNGYVKINSETRKLLLKYDK